MTGHPKILVGIDGTPRGDDALAFATVLAHMAGRNDATSDTAAEVPRPFSSPPPPTVRTDRGAERVLNEQRFGSPELEIESVGMFDDRGEPAAELRSGQPLRIDIAFTATSRSRHVAGPKVSSPPGQRTAPASACARYTH